MQAAPRHLAFLSTCLAKDFRSFHPHEESQRSHEPIGSGDAGQGSPAALSRLCLVKARRLTEPEWLGFARRCKINRGSSVVIRAGRARHGPQGGEADIMKPTPPTGPGADTAVPEPLSPPARKSCWRRLLSTGLGLLPFVAALAAFALYVPTNVALVDLLFVYPPPLLYLMAALVGAVYCARNGFRVRLIVSLLAAVMLVASVGWGGVEPPPASNEDFTLLAMNVDHDPDNAQPLAALCRVRQVDFALLQEIRPYQQEAFLDAFAEFACFRADPKQFSTDRGQISSLTFIRKALLDSPKEVQVETGITGYRTFAVRATVRGQPLWLVNVHTGRFDLAPHHPLRVLRQFANHRGEGERLAAWLPGRDNLPVVVAGDFNAPRQSSNLRDLPAMTLAYDVAGRGPHLTFPTAFPLAGIDHTLGNRHIEFRSYMTFDAGFSDHKGQLVHFRVRR
jgi:endonuclease/exonuclease/phosphatase (EEP) superfamily protein YafD